MKYKTFLKYCFLLFAFSFSACKSDSTSQKINESDAEHIKTLNKLAKKWVLLDDIVSDSPTMIIMSFEKSGYFVIYDTIIDPKFAEAGINKIQPISKGQWKYKNNEITLTHLLPESNNPEIFKVENLSSTKLIMIGSNNKEHKYAAQ
jgi:hypothetical protein